MAIKVIILCMPEPWQGRASAGKQFLTELGPLPLLTYPYDQFASDDFFLGLFFPLFLSLLEKKRYSFSLIPILPPI